MKYLLLASLILVGCKEVNNAPTDVVEKEAIIPTSAHSDQKFEGLYYFEEVDSGEVVGPLEITVHYDGKITARQKGLFRSQNFNGSFGTHPTISFSSVVPYENSFSYSKDINYSSSNDLEEDGTTSDLGSGKHYTVYEFELIAGYLELTIKIHEGSLSDSGSINSIVIERRFREL